MRSGNWVHQTCSYLGSHITAAADCSMRNLHKMLRRGPWAMIPGSRIRTTRDYASPNSSEAWDTLYADAAANPITELSSAVAQAVADLTNPHEVLLEAGCGGANLSAELATMKRSIALCDFSTNILQRARLLFERSGLEPPRIVCCDLTKPFPWRSGSVDVVWSSGVLEHWTDDEVVSIIGEMARISRRCVISLVPYAGCILYRLSKYMAEQRQVWPYGREIPRKSFESQFLAAGLRDIQEYTLGVDAAPNLFGLLDPELYATIERWWSSLSPNDPVKVGQGYLLLTVGYVRGLQLIQNRDRNQRPIRAPFSA